MPPYWLAMGLLVLVFLTLYPRPIDLADLVRSLALVPYWSEDGGARAVPFLWVGWTLFFEMVFYFWFGLFVVWRREAALDYVLWCGVPALLLAFAVLSGTIALPWPVLVNRAGDVSYALYLLHVPMAWLWLWTWPKLTRRLPFVEIGPWNYAVTATLAVLVAARAFFTFIEKPMTLALNRWLVSPHRPQG